MQKRYQLLIPDWLEDYLKYIVDKHDVSFSEVIRLEVCFSVLSSVTNLYPEYKPGMTPREILEFYKKNARYGMDSVEMHRIMSNIYFEARKAAEYRLAKGKKPGKKGKKRGIDQVNIGGEEYYTTIACELAIQSAKLGQEMVIR